MTKKNVSVLGLGAMGSRIARRLADGGHAVTLWNRSAEAARSLAAEVDADVAASPAHAAAAADIVISMVADDQASAHVWLAPGEGALAAMAPDAVAVEASTITPSMARQLAAAAASAGRAFLEAPVVGSRPQADAGQLFVLVGGRPDVLAGVEPVISAYAGAVRHVGDVGAAATMKLAINGLFGMQVAAYAEIVGMLGRSDIGVDDAVDVLTALPITSPGLQRILGLIAERDFAPNFPVGLVAKDFRYLVGLAAELDAELPVAAAAAAVYDAGAAGPHAELDIAGIAAGYLPN